MKSYATAGGRTNCTHGIHDRRANAWSAFADHHRHEEALLLKGYLLVFSQNVFPVDCVDILALLVLPLFLLPAGLKLVDLRLSLLSYTWSQPVGADNHPLSIILPGPWVGAIASKTFEFTSSGSLPIGWFCALAASILVNCLLSKTLECVGQILEELLTPLLITTHNFKNIGHHSLSLDKCLQHIDEDTALIGCKMGLCFAMVGVISFEAHDVLWVNVGHEDPGHVNRVFFHVIEVLNRFRNVV
jgi:hypothetical protein